MISTNTETEHAPSVLGHDDAVFAAGAEQIGIVAVMMSGEATAAGEPMDEKAGSGLVLSGRRNTDTDHLADPFATSILTRARRILRVKCRSAAKSSPFRYWPAACPRCMHQPYHMCNRC